MERCRSWTPRCRKVDRGCRRFNQLLGQFEINHRAAPSTPSQNIGFFLGGLGDLGGSAIRQSGTGPRLPSGRLEQLANGCQQQGRGTGLRQHDVATGGSRLVSLRFGVATHGDNFQRRGDGKPTEAAAQLHAVQVGHREVGDHEVEEWQGPSQCQGLPGGGGFKNLHAATPEDFGVKQSDLRIVVDNDPNGRGHVHRG